MKKEVLLTIGQALQQERLNKDISIDDIANAIKIRKTYIRAIEAGDTRIMKFDVYTIGYIKQYAEFLGMDSTYYVELAKDDLPYEISAIGSENIITGKEFLPSKIILYPAVIILIILYIVVEFMR